MLSVPQTGHSATAFEMLTGLAKPLGFFAPILSEHFCASCLSRSVTLHFPHWICGYFIVYFTFLTTVGLAFIFSFPLSFSSQLPVICSRKEACPKPIILTH